MTNRSRISFTHTHKKKNTNNYRQSQIRAFKSAISTKSFRSVLRNCGDMEAAAGVRFGRHGVGGIGDGDT
ncbi:hypothetical protein ACFX2G_022206 [Malus domestica]